MFRDFINVNRCSHNVVLGVNALRGEWWIVTFRAPSQYLIPIGSFSKIDQSLATSGKEAADILLNRSELGVTATLALEVVEQGSECGEALTATFAGLVGAVIQRSLVGRAADVLLESFGPAELAVTNVALVAETVISRAGVPG
jgi:hypothetical protein